MSVSDRNEFIEAVGKYWDIAYEEGKAGRTHDTQGGQAQITWGRILDRYDAIAARLAADEVLLNEAWRKNESLRARLAEAEALLREARDGVKNSAVQFGYPYTDLVDRIDAFLAPADSASAQGEKGAI